VSTLDGISRAPTADEVRKHEAEEGISEWLHRCGEHSAVIHATADGNAAIDADTRVALCNRGRWWPLANGGSLGPRALPCVDD